MMLRFAAPTAIAVWFVVAAPMAFAQSTPGEGTSEEQDACHGDAVKFCKNDVPDTFKVLTCLQNNRTKISQACQAVLKSHNVLEPPVQRPVDR